MDPDDNELKGPDSGEYTDRCTGCIFNIVGLRRDQKGRVLKVDTCDSERWNKAQCMPVYDFDDAPQFVIREEETT